jgi:hypothetical protein
MSEVASLVLFMSVVACVRTFEHCLPSLFFLNKETLYYIISQHESPTEYIEIKSLGHHTTKYIQNLRQKQT